MRSVGRKWAPLRWALGGTVLREVTVSPGERVSSESSGLTQEREKEHSEVKFRKQETWLMIVSWRGTSLGLRDRGGVIVSPKRYSRSHGDQCPGHTFLV